MRVPNLVSDIDPRKWSAKGRLILGVVVAAGVVAGSLAAFPQRPLSVAGTQPTPASPDNSVAQGTLPLPTPGTAPAPATAPSDADAKARAALLAAKANIDISDAWTRATSGTTAQVFLELASAKDGDKLLSVEAPMAAKVELQDDAKPGAAPTADIPGGATLNFSPQGRHLTLVGLKAPLTEGDSFLLTFKFDKAGIQSTSVKILAANATGLPPPSATRAGDTTANVSQP